MSGDAITEYLQERVDGGDFPSAVYLVAEKGEIVFHEAIGYAVVEPEQIEAKKDTIYDLASLTKPLVMGLLCAQQIEDGDIRLASRIGDEHIVFTGSSEPALTVKDLATHTSGLPAWLPLYLIAESTTNRDVGAVISECNLTGKGSNVEYSDLNFVALAIVIEQGRPDSEFEMGAAKELGLARTAFNPISKGFERRDIAASENGSGYERQMCEELGYSPPANATGSHAFRDGIIWGEVHDGNAYFMGGVAGHAGLFSTAEEVFKIALQILPNYTRLLNPETCQLFRTNFTSGMNEDRSFSFQLASTKDSTAGTKMSPESFGHNGFTGTSLWIDPIKDRVFILLTNRTHNRQLPFANINGVRRRFHDIAIESLDAKK